MKKIIRSGFVILFALVLFSGTLVSQAKQGFVYFEKSGTVEYKYSGTTKGTSTVYFDNYGSKRAEYSTLKTTVFGFSSESKTLDLFVNNFFYSIDLDKKTGTKMSWDDIEEYQNKAVGSKKDRQKLAEEMWEKMGGRKTGTGTVLGKTCEIWEATTPPIKSWVWHNIPLKSEMSIMGMTIKIEATKISTGSVSASKFKIPSGIKIEKQEMPKDMPNFFGK
ncbi:MAG: hypothetical protein PF588_08110 [Candidatus Kapabacteria bacterium]|jgi:hypothetical protein|nr:hypothetical protein [Candidatus Kapabacteria bacterium]